MPPKGRDRLSQEDIKARLMFLIGAVLSFVFLVVTLGITYALIFVTQPIGAQAPNDAAFIAPALLANTAITGIMDETVFPTIEGFKWRKLFFAQNSTPITGRQIAIGVYLAALEATIASRASLSPFRCLATFRMLSLNNASMDGLVLFSSSLFRVSFSYVSYILIPIILHTYPTYLVIYPTYPLHAYVADKLPK